MKKITILALHLGVGGVENWIASVSNILCEKYDVEIISTYKIVEEPSFFIDERVKIKYLIENLKPNEKEFKQAIKDKNILNILKEGIKAVKVLRLKKKLMIKEIKSLDSDIIISTRDIHNSWLGKYGKKEIIKIASEHNHHNYNKKYIKKIKNSLKNIDYFLPVSMELTDFYSNILKDTKTKCIYIPHCLEYYPEKTSNLNTNNIISIGRLSQEKGFIDLIDIFNIVNQYKKDSHLNIIGDGSELESLKNRIAEHKLQNKITLCGFKNREELDKLYLNSSLYVMTSYTESFGLVLIEAESYGIPLLAFDSAQGAKEIITNDKNGFLIKNRSKELMAKKIVEILNDEEKKQRLGKAGREISEKYKKENISKKWYEFIDKILS